MTDTQVGVAIRKVTLKMVKTKGRKEKGCKKASGKERERESV